ncbi:MAG: kynureninase [Anaerolineae bacterium]|nr:MAG: kynureninase [Anaerolineae bacterium]
MDFSVEPEFARRMDADDPLAALRERFVIHDPDEIYLDGNSLGRLPRPVMDALRDAVERQWGQRLIRGWNEGWIHLPRRLGERIAPLIGAQPHEVLVSEGTSINLFKLALAALRVRPGRHKIVSDVFNFPGDLYILQGIVDLLGEEYRLELIPSRDGVHIHPDDVAAAIDEDTALVALTHVAFKSAFMYDMQAVTEQAHQAGALMLWDLCHSVGAVPLELNACDVDLAVGCTYKYLNGGPGSPAFLYVRADLISQLQSPLWGWFAAARPFDFDLDFIPVQDISRFRAGTIPVLSMLALEASLDVFSGVDMNALRARSVQLSEYLLYLADQWLLPLGFEVGSPRDPARRGSHISLRHSEGFRITRALIEAPPPKVRVIPDFRAPDNIRLGISPLYTTFEEIYRALSRLREIVETGEYEAYSAERQAVT